MLKIADVAKASAGERAGLRVDDRITAIAGEPIAKRSLAQWRALLCDSPVGTTLALRFVRAGKEQATELTLADRIRPDAASSTATAIPPGRTPLSGNATPARARATGDPARRRTP